LQVIMRVPLSVCIVVDYKNGLCLPDQAWPRLRKCLQRHDSQPWDILQVRPQSQALTV
jgi:hypothetical protein